MGGRSADGVEGVAAAIRAGRNGPEAAEEQAGRELEGEERREEDVGDAEQLALRGAVEGLELRVDAVADEVEQGEGGLLRHVRGVGPSTQEADLTDLGPPLDLGPVQAAGDVGDDFDPRQSLDLAFQREKSRCDRRCSPFQR